MTYRPVIFLAFANDQDAYLANLQREEDQIYGSLQHAHDAGYIEIYNRGRATLDDIFSQFSRFRDRVAIFHYGGHANGSQLELEGEKADARGLAKLMGQQKSLQLVFLNGCSTQGQVQHLLDSGVKAVIATSVPINDDKAVIFSHQFYDSLSKEATIKQAFEEAVSRLVSTKDLEEGEAKIWSHRGIGFKESLKENKLPWGLYVQEEEHLAWKLPTVDKRMFSDPYVGKKTEEMKVNGQIVLPVFEAMSKYDETFVALLTPLKAAKNNPVLLDLFLRQIMDLIIKHFPWPVGIKLRTLFSSDNSMIYKSKDRLQQLINTYVRLSKFMLYILLAQVWDMIAEEAPINLKKSHREEIEDLLRLNPNNYLRFDHLGLMSRILATFLSGAFKPFIEEYHLIHKSFEEQDDFYQAYLYLEGIRSRLLRDEIEESEFVKLCDACEYNLSLLLQKCTFLVTYNLISIKDIGISKPRRKPASFKHQLGVLAGVAIEVMEGTPKNFEEFTDSHSILLVKGIEKVSENLNLSPLILDENAYKGINTPKIYMYAFNQGGQNYYYEHVDNDSMEAVPQLIADMQTNPGILEQFELFKSEMT